VTATGTHEPSSRASLQWLAGDQAAVERLPMLRQALDRVGAACSEDFRSVASTPLRFALQDIVTAAAGAALAFKKGDQAVALLNAPVWRTRLVLCVDRPAVFALVELLLGGDGSEPAYAPERELTCLEVDVAALFIAGAARALGAAFAPIAATQFTIEATSSEVNFDVIDPQEAVVVARYRLDAFGRGGDVLLAVPQRALAALRKPLSQGPPKDPTRPDPGWARQIEKELARTSVRLTAILEERAGLLAEVFALRVGQVIELQATPQSRVRVECNGERLMWCDLGKSSGAYTLRIDSFVDREQEFMDDILVA
jgi:flagellar motor switch protein FliM